MITKHFTGQYVRTNTKKFDIKDTTVNCNI